LVLGQDSINKTSGYEKKRTNFGCYWGYPNSLSLSFFSSDAFF
jgi:hypothetical protein